MPKRRTLSVGWGLVVPVAAALAFHPAAFPAEPLSEFAYRQLTLIVTGPDHKPVPGVAVYGFCRELNLVWPRRDNDREDWDHLIRWHESFLGTTGAGGAAKVVVPPGKWGFFAAARLLGKRNVVLAVWTDFRQRASGETIRLSPLRTKRWDLRLPDGSALASKGFMSGLPKFPIWIAAPFSPAAGSIKMAISGGDFQLWATGDATRSQPGFVLSLGTLSAKTGDGQSLAPEKTSAIECRGGRGRAFLKWFRRDSFGLDGEVALSDSATLWMSPGVCTLGYRRPVGSAMTAEFVGQSYTLKVGEQTTLDFDAALTAAVDYHLWKTGKKADEPGLHARLYLVDDNGHLLGRLSDASARPVKIGASVVLDGKRFSASQTWSDENTLAMTERGEFKFLADVGSARSDTGAVWDFVYPPGVSCQHTLTQQNSEFTSDTFKTKVPKVLEKHARNLLAQIESLAREMEAVSSRKRSLPVTDIIIIPGRSGASGSHSGKSITIGTRPLFANVPTLDHTVAHELAHNYRFYHGGLMELVVEICRCEGAEQISQQAGKWMFMDRMNGIRRKEVHRKYPNIGLYLFLYARGGKPFLQFMLANEQPARENLSKQGFSDDEITVALCNLASGHDMTPICLAYGLSATPPRIKLAAQAWAIASAANLR